MGEVDDRNRRSGGLDDPVEDPDELVVEAVVAEKDDRARGNRAVGVGAGAGGGQPAWV